MENILITTVKCCLKIREGKTRKRIKSLSNKKWFDKECRLKRHELRKLANKKHQDPLNTIIREQYHDTLAQYKKLLNSKKNDYYNAKISELEKTADNSDAKTFWQCLKSMDDTRKGEDVPSISEENWLQYFHNLHSNELTQRSLRSKRFQSSYGAEVRAGAKKKWKGEGEGRRGNACPQTPRFWKTPLDISRFGSFVN